MATKRLKIYSEELLPILGSPSLFLYVLRFWQQLNILFGAILTYDIKL